MLYGIYLWRLFHWICLGVIVIALGSQVRLLLLGEHRTKNRKTTASIKSQQNRIANSRPHAGLGYVEAVRPEV